jgi:hypothetical protein
MKKQNNSNSVTPSTITIPGKALQSGFCLYIHEIVNAQGSPVAYYVGITGDNHYPSARSPFHRLAGHFDRAAGSTQRQLGNAIESKFEDYLLEDLTIKMHYYSITGFAPITGATNKKGVNHFSSPRFADKLTEFRIRRKEVLDLENWVISLFRDQDLLLLNKTTTPANRPTQPDLLAIAADITTRFLSGQK